jgi:hypothetical protein
MQHYRLNCGRPEAGGDYREWGEWMQRSIDERTVDRTEIHLGQWTVHVITHFTGIEPQYETNVYGGQYDKYQWSYETLGAAKMGHWYVVDLVNALDADPEGLI